MVTFVHIADERYAKAIGRGGLRLPKRRFRRCETEYRKYGVFALPVIRNYIASHQWVRELKRRGYRTSVGVYFQIPDDEPVWAGHFNLEKAAMTAAEAAGLLVVEKALGFEVVIPRSIKPAEIVKIRPLPQAVGWRYYPEAHGRSFCCCALCQRGEYKGRKNREKFEARMAQDENTQGRA